MGSVVLKNGVQVLWAIERVVKLTKFFHFHEITVKSDAAPAIFTFRDRVLEGVQSRGHGETNKRMVSLRLPWCSCAESSERPSATLKDPRKNQSEMDHLCSHGGTPGSILSRCQNRRDGGTPFERFVPLGGKSLTRPISIEPLNGMSHRCRFGIWLGTRRQQCSVGTIRSSRSQTSGNRADGND